MYATGVVDPRAARTKAALRAALLDLAGGDAGLRAASVSAVTARAGVNRVTFYAHYAGLDALVVDALATEVDGLGQLSRELGEFMGADRTSDHAPAGLLRFFTFLQRRTTLLRHALGADGNAAFAGWLRTRMVANAIEALQLDPTVRMSGVPIERQADFIVGALLGVVIGWVSDDPTTPAAEVADQTWLVLRSQVDRQPNKPLQERSPS